MAKVNYKEAWHTLKEEMLTEYPQLIIGWESSYGEGEHAEMCKSNEILKRMDELDGTNEFRNLLDDMNRIVSDMAYEYEEEIVQQNLSDFRLFGKRFHTQKSRESREVYAKAKAWDNYLADVESGAREVTSNEDEVKWHVDYAINEYMEDK